MIGYKMAADYLESLINTKKYPIIDRHSANYAKLVKAKQEEFADTGVCLFSDFLLPDVTTKMCQEVLEIVEQAHECHEIHNCFLGRVDNQTSPDEVRSIAQTTSLGVIGFDQLTEDGSLVLLYQNDKIRNLLGDILGYREFYRLADPIGAMTVNVMNSGHSHGWHFDEALFTVSVMLQSATGGGEFEYLSGVKNEQRTNDTKLQDVLNGDNKGVRTIPIVPGSLLLFGGKHMLHRVTEVSGDATRLITTLCYRDKPGITNSPEVRQMFYGRKEPLFQHSIM